MSLSVSEPLAAVSTVAAYQDVTLTELRGAFDRVDFDLREALEREARVNDLVLSIEDEIGSVRNQLMALGIEVADIPHDTGPASEAPSNGAIHQPGHGLPVAPTGLDFSDLTALAEARLAMLEVDLSRDPLLQVLPEGQIRASLQQYDAQFGDVSWTKTDWAVVLGAGVIATILDVVLVRIPADRKFMGKKYEGSPLTDWLNENSKSLHERFGKPFEGFAKVPFDAPTTKATNDAVRGMFPKVHRLMSPGHDPILGFLVGIADLMRGTGTYVDHLGNIVQVATNMAPADLTTALLKQVAHLLSDVFTPAGLPAPLFSLLQLVKTESPFALWKDGPQVPWTDVARDMYRNGYDLRHFLTMGIVPAAVEVIIRAYWMLDALSTGKTADQRNMEIAKLRSMLLLGHTVATSGTLVKTGLVFGMNPAALNYPQLLAMVPATIAWLKESIAREQRIGSALEAEWMALIAEDSRFRNSEVPSDRTGDS